MGRIDVIVISVKMRKGLKKNGKNHNPNPCVTSVAKAAPEIPYIGMR